MFQFYKPKFFAVWEFVSKQAYADRGEKAIHLMNPLVLMVADKLREHYGPAIINTYGSETLIKAYGMRSESGHRTPDCIHYRPYSQHSLGNALDMIFRDVSAEQVRQDIIDGVIEFDFPIVIEEGVSWLHIAVGNYQDNITIVYPRQD